MRPARKSDASSQYVTNALAAMEDVDRANTEARTAINELRQEGGISEQLAEVLGVSLNRCLLDNYQSSPRGEALRPLGAGDISPHPPTSSHLNPDPGAGSERAPGSGEGRRFEVTVDVLITRLWRESNSLTITCHSEGTVSVRQEINGNGYQNHAQTLRGALEQAIVAREEAGA